MSCSQLSEVCCGPSSAASPKRIAIIATKMDEGGAVNVALQLAAGLRSRGYQAETWFLYVERPTLLGQPHIRAMLPGRPRSPLDYFRMTARVHAALRSFRPDAVHGVMPLGNVIGLTAAKVVGCRSRVASQHQPHPTLAAASRWLDSIAGSAGVYTANVAVSKTVQSSFAHLPKSYRDRLTVIPNGVADRASTLSLEAARAAFGLPAGPALLGTVGRLAPEKNHAFLLEVLALAPEAHLAIAGAGELDAYLQQRVVELGLSGRVHMLGRLAGESVPDFLRALDLFVFPSLYEGMPIALLEAMRAELPIVASNILANFEVANGCAVLMNTGSAEAWATEVRRLLAHRQAGQSLAAAGRNRAAGFTHDAVIDAYERLLFAPDGAGPVSTQRARPAGLISFCSDQLRRVKRV